MIESALWWLSRLLTVAPFTRTISSRRSHVEVRDETAGVSVLLQSAFNLNAVTACVRFVKTNVYNTNVSF